MVAAKGWYRETIESLEMCTKTISILLIISLLLSFGALAADGWPGLPPDCWSETRNVHSAFPGQSHWEHNVRITARNGEKPKSGEISPNKGYLFVVQGGRPTGQITIYAEKDHLTELNFSELFGFSDIRWVSEKLIFIRAWWGRIAATDFIFDVEKEKIVYSEGVTDATQARQQYLESCPTHGCQCIKKD
ncbi:MAG: hypothetical protein ACU836_18455, partial [Gammaproteobacteria bacterium]